MATGEARPAKSHATAFRVVVSGGIDTLVDRADETRPLEHVGADESVV